MAEMVYCESCGKPNQANARFCEHCGAAQHVGGSAERASGSPPTGAFTRPPASVPAGSTSFDTHTAERLDQLAPGASEFAGQVAEGLRTPAVAFSLITAGLAAAVCFGIGVLLALVLSDQSILGVVSANKGVVTGGFAQMVGFVQAGFGQASLKLSPTLFVVFPVGACAIVAATQTHRVRQLTARVRLLSGLAVGIPFGLLMLIPALGAGSIGGGADFGGDPSVAGAVFLGMLWGAVGGVAGSVWSLRRERGAGILREVAPGQMHEAGATVLVGLRPLAVLLAVMSLAGGVVWTVETVRDHSLRGGRSTVTAAIDAATYLVDHGVHWTELGADVKFRPAGSELTVYTAVPVARFDTIAGDLSGGYRLFSFRKAMPAYTFIPLIIFLIAVPLLVALYTGFALARLRRGRTPYIGAAWGALTGPIWAIAMVIINSFTSDLYGGASGDSVFGMFLLAGTVLGAIGGFVGSQGSPVRPDAAVGPSII